MGQTAYFNHTRFNQHAMGSGHPECPERLAAIEDRLLITGVGLALDRREPPMATFEQLARAHDADYILSVMAKNQQLQADIQAGGSDLLAIDPDTSMNRFTLEAAMYAAGAAIAATDAVINGENTNAFCAVRPPGHHATRNQAMGFCFFNNIAIAAKHAVEVHGLQRVVIVDFDVHHGNGTEDIVAGDERIMMLGIFQTGLYPFSGEVPLASNVHNQPMPAYSKGDLLRKIVTEHWLPELARFKPQLILISAGFDAHRDDELAQLGLVEQDYAWLSERLVEAAETYSQGRIVSTLEGGYDLRALSCSVEQHLRALAGI